MKRVLFLVMMLFVSGCLVRTYTITRPRTDLEVTGNRGYIMGEPKEELKPNRLGTERKIPVVEIELGAHNLPPAEGKEEVSETPTVASLSERATSSGSEIDEEIARSSESTVEEITPIVPEPTYTEYVIQKNDTLQKISQKFYGTTKKWKFLYNVNKDVLKSPDKIYPGQKIKIPIYK